MTVFSPFLQVNMNLSNGVYSCEYNITVTDTHWIRPLDIVLGIAFLIISVSTIFLNAFVIYSFAKTSRKLQGTSLVLFQVAINDLISGTYCLGNNISGTCCLGNDISGTC